jgi:hypothetical protein
METMTSDRKVQLTEVRVKGNRFTVVTGAVKDKLAASEGHPTGSTAADPVSDEKTGIIPKHVWG